MIVVRIDVVLLWMVLVLGGHGCSGTGGREGRTLLWKGGVLGEGKEGEYEGGFRCIQRWISGKKKQEKKRDREREREEKTTAKGKTA